jgi:hypothetical protein
MILLISAFLVARITVMSHQHPASFRILHADIRHPVFSATFVEEAVFSPSYVLDTFVKNQVAVAVWIYV